VDDEAGWRFIVKDCLQDAGFKVVTAQDATEAMMETDGLKLDLIIVDLNLAGENGFTLLQFLKVNYPEVSFLLYSGLPPADLAVQTARCEDTQPFLRKGAMQELLGVVRTALNPERLHELALDRTA